jgi:hypothetical protein
VLTFPVAKGENPHGYIFRKDHTLGPITKEDINAFLKSKKSQPLEKIKHEIGSLTSKKASKMQQTGFHETVNIVAGLPVIKESNSVHTQNPAYV